MQIADRMNDIPFSGIRKIFEQERGAPGGDPFQVFWSFYPLGVAAESFSAGKAKKSRKRHQGAG